MFCAGYLLVGGKSSRMGRDKALLTLEGAPIAQRLAGRLAVILGSPVTLIGDPARYLHLGLRVIPDRHPNEGPLAGIEAALRDTTAEWSFVLGCDMPGVPDGFLQRLVDVARQSQGVAAVVPEPVPDGWEPLCAIYHRSCLTAVEQALTDGRRRVKDLLGQLPVASVNECERRWFQNLNTPEDWDRYQASLAAV